MGGRMLLSVAVDDYPNTAALKRGEVHSPGLTFTFSDIKPANRFFKPMVREQCFDVSEMAIVTYIQAKSYNKPLVLLPITIMGRFQHGTILCRSADSITPDRLPGRRVGVRSYSQTTAMWVRGILQNDYGVDPKSVHWITFEDAHVAEYRDPAGVERASGGKSLLTMLRDGDIDAAIYGADLPGDPGLASVIPDPEAAARRWYERQRVVPINHMLVVKENLAKGNSGVIRELYRLFLASKRTAGLPGPDEIDFLPFGFQACRPALQLAVGYALQQSLIERKIAVEELFDETTRRLES
jgi:4,5-dihydroxyphthalate decarboxylase